MSRVQSANASRHTSPARSDRGQSSPGRSLPPIAAREMPNIDALMLEESRPTQMVEETRPVQRPGFGTLGKPLLARVNWIKLDVSKCDGVQGYAAEHKESNTKRDVRTRIVQRTDSLLLRNTRFARAASNYGNRFFSYKEHPLVKPGFSTWEHQVDFYEAEETGPRQGDRRLLVSVILQKDIAYPMAPFQAYLTNSNINFSQREAYTAVVNTLLDRAVSENPSLGTYARRTKFFDITNNNGRFALGEGLEAYKGYFKSTRVGLDGLFLNINTSTCAMFKQGRLDDVINDFRVPKAALGAALKSCRVTTEYSGQTRVRTISGLPSRKDWANPNIPPTADNVNIQCPQHGKETVEQHFVKAWPAIQRPNRKAIVVDFGNKVYIPSDLCTIMPGQAYRGFLSPNQTANMINFACRKPNQNRDLILKNGMLYLKFGKDGGPSDFRIALTATAPEMALVKARLLPPPSVLFASGKAEKFESGAWNLRGKKFARAGSSVMVSISYMDLRKPGTGPCPNLSQFLKGVNDGLRTYLSSNSQVVIIDGFAHARELPTGISPDDLATKLKEAFVILLGKGIKIVFIILPDKEVNNYYSVKKAGDLLAGIHTICVVRGAQGVKTDPGTIANLFLKLNSKAMGVNSRIKLDQTYAALLGDNAMLLGTDVTHPGPAAMVDAPSIAAVVATMDQAFFGYVGRLRLQQTKDEDKKAIEMMQDFYGMTLELLELYRAKNGRLPDPIVFVRDGVSDGQFVQILKEEVPQLMRACKKLYEGAPLPKMLVVTTQKRHHTRFYQEPGDTSGAFVKNGNPLPGFTVDTQIVSKENFDFYNVSHACIQGTTRPCKYVVLLDTLKLSADQVQLMMYHMCFAFSRATRSIGIHPAARYADLLCDRARLYFRDVYAPPPTEGQDKPRYRIQDGHWPGKIDGNLKNTMFFC